MADIVAGLQRGSWAGSGDTLDKKFGTYLRRKMLDAFYNRIGVDQWLDTEGIPANSGDKILFKRFIKKALATTAITAGYNATPTARSVQTIEASLSRYGNAEDVGKEVLQTAVANLPEDIMQMFGIEAAETVERLVFTTLAPTADNSLARIDSLPANWTLDQTGTTASTTTTKTRLRNGTYKGNTTVSYWAASTITYLEGKNAGVSRQVTAHGTTGGYEVLTHAAFEYAPEANTRFILGRNIGHTTATAAQQLLAKATAAGGGDLRTARMLLEKNGAIPFQGSFDNLKNAAPEAPRGDYVALVTPEQYMDLLGDTVFQTAAQQGDIWKSKLAGYQIVRFMGMLIHSMGMAHRTNIPTTLTTVETQTYVSGGAGHIATCLGMHAAAMVKPEGYGGKGKAGIKTYIKRPGPQDTSQSNDAFIRLGWDAYFGQKVLNAAWGINLCTVASV